jgi:HSP20 family protein
MTLIRWEPRRDIETAQRRMRSIFDQFDNAVQNGFHLEMGSFLPRVDISEDKENIYLMAELPGINPDDVKITLSEGVLTIRGEKKRREETNEQNYHRIERTYGEFVRQFTLPDNLNEESVQADFTDGVLEIRIAKVEPEKPKEREVKINARTRANGVPQSVTQNVSNN